MTARDCDTDNSTSISLNKNLFWNEMISRLKFPITQQCRTNWTTFQTQMSGDYKIKQCIYFRGENLDQWHEFIENQDIFCFPTASHISYTRKSYLKERERAREREREEGNIRRILSAGRTSIKFLTPEGMHLHTTSILKQRRWRIQNSLRQGVWKYAFNCFLPGQLL
jgi:hypothetical protein